MLFTGSDRAYPSDVILQELQKWEGNPTQEQGGTFYDDTHSETKCYDKPG